MNKTFHRMSVLENLLGIKWVKYEADTRSSRYYYQTIDKYKLDNAHHNLRRELSDLVHNASRGYFVWLRKQKESKKRADKYIKRLYKINVLK